MHFLAKIFGRLDSINEKGQTYHNAITKLLHVLVKLNVIIKYWDETLLFELHESK